MLGSERREGEVSQPGVPDLPAARTRLWGPPRLLTSRWFVGILAFAIAFWVFDLAVLKAAVPHPLDDVWEHGLVARLLWKGAWFRTTMIYPPLWALRDVHTLTVPVLVHGPLLPALYALPLALFGPGALDQVGWLAATFAVLALVPLFRLAARYFDEPAAAVAGVLWTISPLTISAVNHYASVVVGACLLTQGLDWVAREQPRAVLAGLAVGLGYLVRPEMLVMTPVLAAVIFHNARRGLPVAAFLLTFVACASWWWWHHWQATGSPFFNMTSYLLISFSSAHPGDELVRNFAATPDRLPALVSEALPMLASKWVYYFPRAIKHVLEGPSIATGWLAWVGCLAALARPRLRFLAACLGLVAIVPVVAMTLLASIPLYPVPELPLYCLGASIGAAWLAGRLPAWARGPQVWIAAVVLVALPSTVAAMRVQHREARMIERWVAADRAGLAPARRGATGDRLMFSDTPDFVAWTTGRPTLWLTREAFERLYASPDSSTPLPAGLPSAPEPADTWFHDGNPRDPATAMGHRIDVHPRGRAPSSAP